MQSIRIDAKSTKMVAHRGLSGIELENTNAAFIAAGNRSYFGIETDVHKTSDGKFVVIHDDDTGRVGEKNIPVEGSSFAELRQMQLISKDGVADRGDLRIPTLKEYISTCKRYEKTAVLELKNAFLKEEVKAICDEIIDEDYLSHVIFISFDFQNLVYIRSFYPQQPVQFLVDDYSDDLPQRLQEHDFDVDIHYSALTKERIDALHRCGVRINCWTCDDKDTAELLTEYGVDFITSNILE